METYHHPLEIKNQHRNKHVVKNIHAVITVLQMLALFLLIILGFDMVPFFHSSYFRVGPPFTVLNLEINSWLLYIFICVFFVVEKLFAPISIRCVDEVLFESKNPSTPHELVANAIKVFVNWMRLVVTYVFIFSQMSFVIVMAIPDIYMQAKILRDDLANRSDFSRYKRGMMLLMLFEVVVILGIFNACGVTGSIYFQIGPPIHPFGSSVTDDNDFVGIGFFIFVDQIVSNYIKELMNQFRNRKLFNTTHTSFDDLYFTKSGVLTVVMLSGLFFWVRSVFIISFLFSQFTFVLIYFAADVVSSSLLIMYPRTVSRIPYLLVLQGFELMAVIFVIASHNPWKLDYFSSPPPWIIFEVLLQHKREVMWLMVYIGYERFCKTMFDNITEPDVKNAVIYKDYLLGYEDVEIVMFVVVNGVFTWMRTMTLMQFAMSNIFFVMISGSVDIVVMFLITSKAIAFVEKIDKAHKKRWKMMELFPKGYLTKMEAESQKKK